MKKLLTLVFSLLFLSSSSVFADDISDFQIEGISIGDSLLDYMTEEEILKEIEETKDYYYYLKEPNKYAEVYLFKDFSTYKDGLSFFVKNNSTNQYITNKNEKYTILSIRGMLNFNKDFEGCIQKRDEIVEDLSKAFPNAEKLKFDYISRNDPSGESIFDDVDLLFDSGKVKAQCNNWKETFRLENNWNEGLSISIDTEETTLWLKN